MSCKTHEWLNQVKNLTEQAEIDQSVANFVNDPTINPISAYQISQTAAREMLNSGQELPDGLVKGVQALGRADSGFTGLTVHEAFVYSMRSEKKN